MGIMTQIPNEFGPPSVRALANQVAGYSNRHRKITKEAPPIAKKTAKVAKKAISSHQKKH